MNICENNGPIKPTKAISNPVKKVNNKAAFALLIRLRTKDNTDARCPEGRNSGPGLNVSTIPVNERLNSSASTRTRPRAGSFRLTLSPLKPLNTTKWQKFQCKMAGASTVRNRSTSIRNPFASIPYLRAAFNRFSALLPSRDTPQSIRNYSKGNHFFQYAKIMPNEAAPHSSASICITTGTRFTLPITGWSSFVYRFLQTTSGTRAYVLLQSGCCKRSPL